MAKRRRENGEGTIFKRSTGKYLAVISVGWTADGKRVRRSKTATTRADAVAFLDKIRAERRGVPDLPAEKKTTAEYLSWWLENCITNDKSANTDSCYRLCVEKHIIPRIGKIRVTKLTPVHLKTMFSDLNKDGIGSRTRQLIHTTMMQAMSVAKRLGTVSKNPCEAIERPTHEPKTIESFTFEEAQAILRETVGTMFHVTSTLGICCGMRTGEIFGLQWEDVDFEAETLHVARQIIEVRGKVIEKTPKTKRGTRTIQLPTPALESLLEHRKIMLRKGMAQNIRVFCGTKGAPWRKTNFRRQHWRPLLKKLGIEFRGFHATRHTYATLALGAGVPVHVVSAILGHSKPSVTLDIYSHVLGPQQDAAKDTMSRLLG